MTSQKLLNISDPDAEIRSMRIESTILYPRTINDGAYGGACSFVLPSQGFITGDCSIVLPATCTEPGYQYPGNCGVVFLIERATISSAGKVWDEVSPGLNYFLCSIRLFILKEKRI